MWAGCIAAGRQPSAASGRRTEFWVLANAPRPITNPTPPDLGAQAAGRDVANEGCPGVAAQRVLRVESFVGVLALAWCMLASPCFVQTAQAPAKPLRFRGHPIACRVDPYCLRACLKQKGELAVAVGHVAPRQVGVLRRLLALDEHLHHPAATRPVKGRSTRVERKPGRRDTGLEFGTIAYMPIPSLGPASSVLTVRGRSGSC